MMTADEAVEALRRRLPERARVFVQATVGEPIGLYEAFARRPELAAGLTFVGAFVPGMNRRDWAALHPEARAETTFATPDRAATLADGRTRLLPLSYSQTWRWLRSTPLDAALVSVCPPGADGLCSLGPSVDFGPLALARDLLTLAQLNPALPSTANGLRSPLGAYDLVCEAAHSPVAAGPEAASAATLAAAAHAAGFIPDGATLQVGVGSMADAICAQLRDRSALRIHSGLVGDGMLDLLDAGVVDGGVTGVALCRPERLAAVAGDERLAWRAVDVTHSATVLAAQPQLCAVNGALEVDLFGQVNLEVQGGAAVSGVGGAPDFQRGALLSDGGMPIVALAASARGGTISRIVPRLTGPVSLSRHETGVIATEHGAVDLRGLDDGERARALIRLAEPSHREGLERAWRALRG